MTEQFETSELPGTSATTDTSAQPVENPQTQLPQVERIANLFIRGKHGHAALPTSVSASLRRMDMKRPVRSIDSVISTLVAAGFPLEVMSDDEITRWASFVHAVALLSGTSGAGIHKSSRAAGKAIAESGYSSTRFARLLTAQGDSLAQQISRLTRFLAKAPRALPLDLRPIAELLLWDGRNAERADAARMMLARGYYSGLAISASAD